jgi:hypothetical protein
MPTGCSISSAQPINPITAHTERNITMFFFMRYITFIEGQVSE